MTDPVLAAIADGGSPQGDTTTVTLGYQPSVRTAAQVSRAVRRQFGDEAGVQLIDDDILSWINDAQDQIVDSNHALKARAFSDTVRGISQYRFPSNTIEQIDSIHVGGQLIRNIPFTEAERDYIGNDLADVVTGQQPSVWWEWSGAFTLYPTPSDSQQIIIYYSTRPTHVVGLSDTLGVPDKFYRTILAYVMQQAYELDENFEASAAKQQQVQQHLDGFSEDERTAQHMTYETITVLPEDY